MTDRIELIRLLHELADAARTVQMETDYSPENWGGTNKTAIAKAAAAERTALRNLWRALGREAPLTADELIAIQHPYRQPKATA